MNLLCCSVLFWLWILKTFGNKVGTEETSLHSLGTDLRLDSQQLAQLNDLGAPAPKYKENRSEVFMKNNMKNVFNNYETLS